VANKKALPRLGGGLFIGRLAVSYFASDITLMALCGLSVSLRRNKPATARCAVADAPDSVLPGRCFDAGVLSYLK